MKLIFGGKKGSRAPLKAPTGRHILAVGSFTRLAHSKKHQSSSSSVRSSPYCLRAYSLLVDDYVASLRLANCECFELHIYVSVSTPIQKRHMS